MSRSQAIAVHAYGIVEPGITLPERVSGLGGAPVMTRRLGEVDVLVSVLDAARYGSAAWAEHGQDPRWVGKLAREHHAVLQAWSDFGDVLPFRLPSLHAGDRGLQRALKSRLPELSRALSRLHGQREWGLQLVARNSPTPPPRRARTGREYLIARSRAAAERTELNQTREAAISTLHDAFCSVTSAAAVNPPQDAALSGRAEPMLLNAAYLARRDDDRRLQRLVVEWGARLRPLGLQLELTGPWPAYHFANELPSRRRRA